MYFCNAKNLKYIYIYIYHLGLSNSILSILDRCKKKKKDNKSDLHGAYERRVIKVLMLMFEIAFSKAASGLDNAISLGSLFHSVIVVG